MQHVPESGCGRPRSKAPHQGCKLVLVFRSLMTVLQMARRRVGLVPGLGLGQCMQ